MGPVDRIDFVRGEVGFANATIGQSSARRVLSVFSDDDADKQGSFWRHGENLDLWTMLWKPGRQADPVATLTQAQRDPANILLLAAPPWSTSTSKPIPMAVRAPRRSTTPCWTASVSAAATGSSATTSPR
ncbi:hypothetical protein [Roseateles chitinivorans]|uniref:hypothetical protein n=1 Tax=Roseateles chitinivorans TaxID=2917965 RepID=UPI003D6687C1